MLIGFLGLLLIYNLLVLKLSTIWMLLVCFECNLIVISMKHKTKQVWSYTGLSISGIVGTFLQKALVSRKSVGDPFLPEHYFHKPWFITFYMFFAMGLALPACYVSKMCGYKANFKYSRKNVLLCSIPAICDLLMTILHLVSFLYLGVSLGMIIGLSKVIFSATFAKFYLKQKITRNQYAAIAVILISLGFIAVSVVKGTGSPPIESTIFARLLAVLAKLLSFVIDAGKCAFEQKLTQEKNVDPLILVGIEGVWGFLITTFICLPAVHYSSFRSPAGLHEDAIDTLLMLVNSKTITILVVLDATYIFFLNIFHMFAIQSTSALFATLFNSLQGAIIWLSQIVVYYMLLGTKYDEYKVLGEEWNKWSWVQLMGYIIAIIGIFIYNSIIHVAPKGITDNEYISLVNVE